MDVFRNPGTQREDQVVNRQSLFADCSSKWRVKGGRRKGECAHVQQALPLRVSPTGITTFSFCSLHPSSSPLYMHWNHPCTVAFSEILLGQSVISPDISWPPLPPPSSPLCTGIICGQVVISEIICYHWNSPSEFLDTSSVHFSISLYSLTLDGHEMIGGYGIWLEVRF